MQVEFVGQSVRDSDNRQADPSRLLNCYRETIGGRPILKSTLGLSDHAALPGVFVRELIASRGNLYALSGGRASKIDDMGVVTDLGPVDDGEHATISTNNGDVLFCSAGKYYRWDGAVMTQPVAGQFSNFGSVDYIGGYTMLTEQDGIQFCWSDQLDSSTLTPLNFSSADGRDDKIIRGISIGGQYYIFKETSQEVWYNTGGAGTRAFERQAGGIYDVGLKAKGLVCIIPAGSAFYVGHDGRARIIGIPQPVSTPAVETAIKECGPEFCVSWEDEGHTFCAIVFADCPAWVYDLATGEWFERAQGTTFQPWKVSCSAKLGTKWYAGRDGAKIMVFDRSNEDGGFPLVRRAVSRLLENDGKRFVLNELEIFARTGLDAGAIELSISKDRGYTFTAPRRMTWAVGEFEKRLIRRSLGQARAFVAEITISDPIECPINAIGRVA